MGVDLAWPNLLGQLKGNLADWYKKSKDDILKKKDDVDRKKTSQPDSFFSPGLKLKCMRVVLTQSG